MRNVWSFTLQERNVRVIYSDAHGTKLYVDGELRDCCSAASANLLKAQITDGCELAIAPCIDQTEVALCASFNCNGQHFQLFGGKSHFRI